MTPGDLDACSSAHDVVHASLASAVTRLFEHVPIARGDDPEGVHQCRVALRRLRSDLATFRTVLDETWAADLRTRAKPLADALGVVRDDDVHLALVRSMTLSSPVGADPVRTMLRHDRDRHRRSLLALLDSPFTAALFDTLRAIVEQPTAPPTKVGDAAAAPAAEVLTPLVRKRWKRLRREIDAFGDTPSDAELHRVRLAAKRCRYAATTVVTVHGKPAKRFATRLATLQDTLGSLNDTAVLATRLRAQTDGLDPADALAMGEVLGRLGAMADAARGRWRDDWQRASRKSLRRWMRPASLA
ncbi:MAG TPA: CHAD domain-containing protein [Acidimicrobiales bacterium]